MPRVDIESRRKYDREKHKETRKSWTPEKIDSERIRVRNWKRVSRKLHAEKWRKYYREDAFLRSHGITVEERDILLLKQNNQCAICTVELCKEARKPNSAHMDHDHVGGGNRGILCHRCNVAIGLLGEDIPRFEQAIKYLQKYKK